jgi:hypothetical protein
VRRCRRGRGLPSPDDTADHVAGTGHGRSAQRPVGRRDRQVGHDADPARWTLGRHRREPDRPSERALGCGNERADDPRDEEASDRARATGPVTLNRPPCDAPVRPAGASSLPAVTVMSHSSIRERECAAGPTRNGGPIVPSGCRLRFDSSGQADCAPRRSGRAALEIDGRLTTASISPVQGQSVRACLLIRDTQRKRVTRLLGAHHGVPTHADALERHPVRRAVIA